MKNQADFDKAVWRWFLARAQQHEVHARFSPIEKKIANHLRDCGIDYENSAIPDFGSVHEFDGTGDDGIDVEVVTAEDWICNCGKYGARKWQARKEVTLAVPGPYPLSRMTYEIVKESES